MSHFRVLMFLVSLSPLLFSITVQADEAKGQYKDVLTTIAKRCENYKDALRASMDRAPFAKDKKFVEANVEFRYFAECQCMPEKLKGKDLSALTDATFKKMTQELGMECAGQGMKKYWLSMCDGFMKNDIKDEKKRDQACQCIDPLLKQVDDNNVMPTMAAASKNPSDPIAKKVNECTEKFK